MKAGDTLKIGDLRHRIELLDFVVLEDEWMNQKKEWVLKATLWAAVSNLHGREYFAAAAVQLEKMLLFTVRFYPGLHEGMQIRFQGNLYDIKFIDNIKYKSEYLEIKALAVGGD